MAIHNTVLVRTGETVDILLNVTSPGRWVAHCHMAEHHERGRQESVLEMTVIGPTVRDLAGHCGRSPGHVTNTRPVTVDGYRGIYLEVRGTRGRN
jgi:hypothetical protein